MQGSGVGELSAGGDLKFGGGSIKYRKAIAEYTYNSRDLLHAQTDAKGQKQSFEYDDYDRITKVYLGDIGSNEVLIDNSYYTTGHIDKIESSTSMVFDPEGDGTITDHFVYNQFGQVENQVYNHPVGIVDITYVFDKADRLLTTTTVVPGANSNAVETQSFDNYDRLLKSGISFGEESAVLASCRYNGRKPVWSFRYLL